MVVTAQNAPFDVGQMNEAYRLLGIPAPDFEVFDTAAAFREFLKPRVEEVKAKIESGGTTTERERKILKDLTAISRTTEKEYVTVSLGPLTKAFDIPDLGWHAAIADVKMTMAVFLAVMNYVDKIDKEMEGGIPASDYDEEAEKKALADRYGGSAQELTPDVATTPPNIPGLDNLKEQWKWAMTRKQRELIEREIAELTKKS